MSSSIQLFDTGKSIFAQIIKRIRQAQGSIHINIFIWRDDKIGNKIAQELIKAANRGVRVYISKDKLGAVFEKGEQTRQSLFHKEFDLFSWLRSSAISLAYHRMEKKYPSKQKANPLVDKVTHHKKIIVDKDITKGDHSKYFIFDNEIVIVGGVNVGDEYATKDISGAQWIDYAMEIKGRKKILELEKRLLYKTQKSQDSIQFVVNTRLLFRNFLIKSRMISLLSKAKKNVVVQMAYLGDRDLSNQLVYLVQKGVTVTVILPRKANVQSDYNHKIIRKLLQRTNNKINVYLCRSMLHAKMISVDDRYALIGSANLNYQTMKKLSELNVLVSNNKAFMSKLKKSVTRHKKNSKRITHYNQISYDKIRAFLEGFIC